VTAPRRRLWPAIAILHTAVAVFFVAVAIARVRLGESVWSVVGALSAVVVFGGLAVIAVRRDRAGLPLLPNGWQKRHPSG
jgi:hypothetical protein